MTSIPSSPVHFFVEPDSYSLVPHRNRNRSEQKETLTYFTYWGLRLSRSYPLYRYISSIHMRTYVETSSLRKASSYFRENRIGLSICMLNESPVDFSYTIPPDKERLFCYINQIAVIKKLENQLIVTALIYLLFTSGEVQKERLTQSLENIVRNFLEVQETLPRNKPPSKEISFLGFTVSRNYLVITKRASINRNPTAATFLKRPIYL